MFSKTGTTLKAITPNRLASEAKHFPYGETDGTPPADTKDYFATYRRDGTGLDYAWNRYYSPTMGRFTTADPYEGSVSLGNPHSWNRYTYTDNNPVNYLDPTGLLTVNEIQALIGSVLNNVAPNIPMTIHVQAGLEALATNTVMLYHFSSYIGWSSQLPFMQNSSSSQPVPRPGTLMVKNLKKDGFHFDRVFEIIHDLMNTINKDCLNFLESGGTSAQEYTQALLDNNLLATGQFDNTIAAFNGTGGSDVPEGYAAIVVNTDGAFFNSGFTIPGSNSTAGTARAQASILLHELAHGLGSSGFLPDRNNKNAGKQNNEMIEKNCGGTLSEFDNRITSN
jgi:RHS repeat-associated protein